MLPLTKLKKYIIKQAYDEYNKFTLGIINSNYEERIYRDGSHLRYRYRNLSINFYPKNNYLKFKACIKPDHFISFSHSNNIHYISSKIACLKHGNSCSKQHMCENAYRYDVIYENYYNREFHTMSCIYLDIYDHYKEICVNYARYYNAKDYTKYLCQIFLNKNDFRCLTYFDNQISVIKIVMNKKKKIYKRYF